jgi:hypothetical protein
MYAYAVGINIGSYNWLFLRNTVQFSLVIYSLFMFVPIVYIQLNVGKSYLFYLNSTSYSTMEEAKSEK